MSDTGIRLGTLAVNHGMVTLQDLHQALSTQAREAAEGKIPRQLGLILLSEGRISEGELDVLLRHQETFPTPAP